VKLSLSAVDVWRVDLREVGAEALRLLCAAERERAARIGNLARRALWMRGRATLRVLLGEYLGRGGDEIELVAGRHGKPALGVARAGSAASGSAASGSAASGSAASGSAASGSELLVHFNLSHSGPLALYAFTAAAPVGVDVELVRGRGRGEHARDEVALAERVFGAQPAERLRRLDAPTRRREFLAMWVRHEAALKCLGRGLTAGAQSSERETLWIENLDVGAGAAAALAVAEGPLELCLRDWPPQPM
jgi:4'-phosphopantetheinyl transferase